MKNRTVAIVLVVVALLILTGIGMRRNGGGAVARWIGAIHGTGGH
jgi:hypothetical protein